MILSLHEDESAELPRGSGTVAAKLDRCVESYPRTFMVAKAKPRLAEAKPGLLVIFPFLHEAGEGGFDRRPVLPEERVSTAAPQGFHALAPRLLRCINALLSRDLRLGMLNDRKEEKSGGLHGRGSMRADKAKSLPQGWLRRQAAADGRLAVLSVSLSSGP